MTVPWGWLAACASSLWCGFMWGRAVAEGDNKLDKALDRIAELERQLAQQLQRTADCSGEVAVQTNRANELERELAETHRCWDETNATIAKYQVDIDDLEREVARLKGYAAHKAECAKWVLVIGRASTVESELSTVIPCTCGLDVESRMEQACATCGHGPHEKACRVLVNQGTKHECRCLCQRYEAESRMKGLEK